MRRIFLVSTLTVLWVSGALFIWGQLVPAAEPPVDFGPTPVVADAEENPLAAMRRVSRADRKFAKEVIRDAADASGMRRLEFMRAVQDGDVDAVDELKMSLASHDDAPRFDPDEFGQFLTMILEFIEKLMAIFGMFASNSSPVIYTMAV